MAPETSYNRNSALFRKLELGFGRCCLAGDKLGGKMTQVLNFYNNHSIIFHPHPLKNEKIKASLKHEIMTIFIIVLSSKRRTCNHNTVFQKMNNLSVLSITNVKKLAPTDKTVYLRILQRLVTWDKFSIIKCL